MSLSIASFSVASISVGVFLLELLYSHPLYMSFSIGATPEVNLSIGASLLELRKKRASLYMSLFIGASA